MTECQERLGLFLPCCLLACLLACLQSSIIGGARHSDTSLVVTDTQETL